MTPINSKITEIALKIDELYLNSKKKSLFLSQEATDIISNSVQM